VRRKGSGAFHYQGETKIGRAWEPGTSFLILCGMSGYSEENIAQNIGDEADKAGGKAEKADG